MPASEGFPCVIRRYRLGEEPKPYEYWLTKTMTERLDALANLIAEHNGWTAENMPRMERVVRIRKQE